MLARKLQDEVYSIFFILFHVSQNLTGTICDDMLHHIQVDDSILSFSGKEPDGSPNIHYYNFYDGIQMI